jgi:coenzyme PQQ synthesis protein D (PqqD)
MAEGRLPTPVEDVVYRELNGEIVLVHLGTDRIYALNETGALFWELLVAGRDRAAIRAQLLQEFAVEPAALDVEIDALVAELARAGLVSS